MPPRRLGEMLSRYEKPLLLVGAFPHGEFKASTAKQARTLVSIYPKPLEAWTVVSRILAGTEEVVYYPKTSSARIGSDP